MYRRWQIVLLTIVLVFVIPGFVLMRLQLKNESTTPTTDILEASSTVAPSDMTDDEQLSVCVIFSDGGIKEMEIESYICGVVLAEMPTSFEEEALKAQAIVARTYTMRRINGNNKHNNGDVCTQPSCCQSYCSEEDYLKLNSSVSGLEKVKNAVSETVGVVLLYGGELIEATYFSCSGGMTEDAQDVWGEDIPYLQSTLSPGEENAAPFMDTVYFDKEEFECRLDVVLSSDDAECFGKPTYTAGLGIKQIKIGGKIFTGKQIRELLNLRSTSFTFSFDGDVIAVTTKGYGHRVGMSQYGAEAMAVAGKTYSEILSHYYKDIEIKRL